MKTKELKELRNKEIKEIIKMLKEKRLAVAKFGPQMRAGKEKNLKRAGLLRKEIAQILTILGEKENENIQR